MTTQNVPGSPPAAPPAPAVAAPTPPPAPYASAGSATGAGSATATASAPAATTATRRAGGSPAHPLKVLGAIAQLAALGLVGPAIFSILFTLLGTGVGLVVVLGIGILFLIALVYSLYAVAWLETARIEGLYGFGVNPPRPRRRVRPGFGGVMLMFWHQAIDLGMWRAIANFTIGTVLGGVVLALATATATGVALAFWPLYDEGGIAPSLWGTDVTIPGAMAPVIGGILAVVSLALIVGAAILHGVLARLLIVPSREAQYQAQAQVSNQQRAGAIRAADVERTRIERDLHDGVQPRLVSVGMTLGLAKQKIDDDPAAAKALIEEAHTSTKAAITELRQLARGIHASVLDDRGLDAALSALAARSHVPVNLDVRMDGRCSRDAETAVYFAIAESLTNAAKHSRATAVRVTVRRRDDGTLWARVEDDGIGGARLQPGGGLDGIANRVLAAGGSYRLDSPNGGPTGLEVSVPCAS